MLKTYAKNLEKTAGKLLKRFAALGTGWWDRYRRDFFFRSQVNVITFQVLFVVAILAIFAFILQVVERNIINAFITNIEAIVMSVNPDGTAAEADIRRQLEVTRELSFVWAMLVMTGITIVFGYIISRVTLYPARHSLESQKRFISDVAHELRTPLSVIRMNADVALLDKKLPSDTQKILRSNIEELDRISETINNLLSLDSVIRPESMKFENVDFGAVVKHAIETVKTVVSKQDVEIVFQQSSYRTVWGNKTGLEQIAVNVIQNALVYSEGQGVVMVVVEPDYHGFVNLIVQDNGIGISEKDLFHIFEPFYRVDKSRARQRGSSGLGLTIVNEMVKLHRGKIAIKSAPQKGTTITISIPCGQDNGHSDKDSAMQDTKGEVSVDFSRHFFTP